jgi:hypothetical protein
MWKADKKGAKMVMLILLLGFSSCHQARQKGKELVQQTEQKAKDKITAHSKTAADKIIPQFDAYTPDTKFNKERFAEFIQVPLTPDVTNIYCFADNIGIDADYQFSFQCDTNTVKRIIAKHQLKPDAGNNDFAAGLQSDFKWWDKKKIASLPLYSWQGEHEYHKYFWYDKTAQQAYFFDFDM